MNTKKIFVFVISFFSLFFLFSFNSFARLSNEIENNNIVPLIQPANTPTPTPIIKIEITGIIKKIPSIIINAPTSSPTNTPIPTQTITPTINPKTSPSQITIIPTITTPNSPNISPTITPNTANNSSKNDSLLINILAGIAISAWIIYGIIRILKNKKNN